MRPKRREFTVADLVAIVTRATDEAGLIHCERCGAWCKRRADYEIDHIIAEGMRPKADKKRKLTPADGQLLCVAVCHPPKTKRDKEDINEAKRREARSLLLVRPGRRKAWWRHGKDQKPPVKIANGPPGMARRFQ
jgi:uncharacterized C2H2 Zn-finger protein